MPHSDEPGPAKTGPERDAQGQGEQNHKGGGNDGTSNASPRVFKNRLSDNEQSRKPADD